MKVLLQMTTLQEEKFHWNLNLANGKFAEFEFTYYYIFRNLTMIAYTIEIQKSKFANH